MKNEKNPEQKQEMVSLNENVYDMFSVKELEERLQMSALETWICGTHDNHPAPKDDFPPACEPNCPLLGCTGLALVD
jgi:hypothetical protein